MLKIRIVAIGEDKDEWITDGCKHYTKLLRKYTVIEQVTALPPKQSANLSPDEIKKLEAKAIAASKGKGILVALSDSGKSCDSASFAKLLERWQTTSGGTVTFLIGGPYGLDRTLLESAEMILSLSPLTFSHQLVRLVLFEQLYRGFTILHNTGYHK
ncbi:MAG: 23S rRNA (pseudouridine(1915)-N(3))-methyltransferase RlmH [candidate division Zixibacteria bacterium]|nr:23S rRNA (pseudouridine(1915)-N(3))-methyltransferase RlmH [candidate division Zixibacteria bacterium]